MTTIEEGVFTIPMAYYVTIIVSQYIRYSIQDTSITLQVYTTVLYISIMYINKF
jgi:hypothetical protein